MSSHHHSHSCPSMCECSCVNTRQAQLWAMCLCRVQEITLSKRRFVEGEVGGTCRRRWRFRHAQRLENAPQVWSNFRPISLYEANLPQPVQGEPILQKYRYTKSSDWPPAWWLVDWWISRKNFLNRPITMQACGYRAPSCQYPLFPGSGLPGVVDYIPWCHGCIWLSQKAIVIHRGAV